jgi:hypothetical protein
VHSTFDLGVCGDDVWRYLRKSYSLILVAEFGALSVAGGAFVTGKLVLLTYTYSIGRLLCKLFST